MHNDIKNKSRSQEVKKPRSQSIKALELSDLSTLRSQQLLLGQVEFINCLPIGLPVELGEVKISTLMINGLPSKLNKMILNNEIDIAPVSSLAYIENKDKLIPISNLCIASNGPADSVLLFSSFPIEELDGAKIALTHASSTSNKLLEIIFKEFLKVNITFDIMQIGLEELSKEYPACLFIGDHALLEFSKKPRNTFIYDLGSLWKKYTSLPMTFGIWVVRKEIMQKYPTEVKVISIKLNEAKEIGLSKLFDKVVKKAQEKVLLSKEFYETYFQHLSYEFTDECKKGLTLFDKYCTNMKKQTIVLSN